jgi:hypothetical protein
MQKEKYGFCPRCFSLGRLQKHHCLPVRFYGRNKHVIYMCADCHQEIESILPLKVKFSPEEYLELTKQFIRGQDLLIPKGGKYGQLRIFRLQGNQPNAV